MTVCPVLRQIISECVKDDVKELTEARAQKLAIELAEKCLRDLAARNPMLAKILEENGFIKQTQQRTIRRKILSLPILSEKISFLLISVIANIHYGFSMKENENFETRNKTLGFSLLFFLNHHLN